jgi:hypothetical protein
MSVLSIFVLNNLNHSLSLALYQVIFALFQFFFLLLPKLLDPFLIIFPLSFCVTVTIILILIVLAFETSYLLNDLQVILQDL